MCEVLSNAKRGCLLRIVLKLEVIRTQIMNQHMEEFSILFIDIVYIIKLGSPNFMKLYEN